MCTIYIYMCMRIQSNRETPLCNPFKPSVAHILKCAPCSGHILCKLLATVRATANWGACTSEDNLDWVMLIRDRFSIRMILRDPHQIDTHTHTGGAEQKNRPNAEGFAALSQNATQQKKTTHRDYTGADMLVRCVLNGRTCNSNCRLNS